MSAELDAFLRRRADRCSACGYHPVKQGHEVDCPLRDDPDATRAPLPRVPPDPMSASREPQRPTGGALGEPIVTQPQPPRPERIDRPW